MVFLKVGLEVMCMTNVGDWRQQSGLAIFDVRGEAMKLCTMVSIVRMEMKVTPSELTLGLTGADVGLRKARQSHAAPKHYQQANSQEATFKALFPAYSLLLLPTLFPPLYAFLPSIILESIYAS